MQVQGNVAVVTGATSGLQDATARSLHASGAQVVIADMNSRVGARAA
jgi:NAD(P)-dependent dehydrogenase (short-subunit alcohol dehydrogenase family)